MNNKVNAISSNKKNILIINLICLWFIIIMFSNSITNPPSIRFLVNIRLDRVLLLVIILACIIYRPILHYKIKLHFAEKMMLVFSCICIISCITSGSINTPSNSHISTVARFIIIPMMIFIISRRLNLDRLGIKRIFFTFILIGLYLGLTGIFEHFNLSFLVYPKYILNPKIGLHFPRSRGPFVQAAVFGSILSIIFIITLFYIKNIENRIIYWLILGIILISIYFSYTRSAWVMFLVSFTIYLCCNKERKYLFVLSMLFALIFLTGVLGKLSFENGTLFSKRQNPVETRINLLKVSLKLIANKPFLGHGYGTFEKVNDEYFVRSTTGIMRGNEEGNHNVISGLLVELGIIGTFPYLIILFYFLKINLTLYKNSKNQFNEKIGIMNIAILSGYFVSIQFFDPRFFAMLNSMIFCLSGIAFSLKENAYKR